MFSHDSVPMMANPPLTSPSDQLASTLLAHTVREGKGIGEDVHLAGELKDGILRPFKQSLCMWLGRREMRHPFPRDVWMYLDEESCPSFMH